MARNTAAVYAEKKALEQGVAEMQQFVDGVTTEAGKQAKKFARVQAALSEVRSPGRTIEVIAGSGVVGAVGILSLTGLGGLIARHWKAFAALEDYIVGGAEITVGAGTLGGALYMRNEEPSLGNDIAVGAGGLWISAGIGKIVKAAWDSRKKQQALMVRLIEAQRRAEAEAEAAQAEAAQAEAAAKAAAND